MYNVLVISQVRFLHEALRDIVDRSPSLRVRAAVATLPEALCAVVERKPDIVLIDAALPNGCNAAARLADVAPYSSLIVFGLRETEDDVIAWAEAGVAGYVPNTASVVELVAGLEAARRGEQVCSSRIAGSLLRNFGRPRRVAGPTPLTTREREVRLLVGAGHSNKEIARRLSISLGTTKSHVHNLLAKLNVTRRIDLVRSDDHFH